MQSETLSPSDCRASIEYTNLTTELFTQCHVRCMR